MPRTHGYAPAGQRCQGSHDWHARGRTNVIGALIGGCLLTVALFNLTINSAVFTAWVKQDLLPKLPQACVVVIDNATFHKRQDTQHAITSTGHTLEYLPAYSPDLNSIEHKWAQAKSLRRKSGRSVENIFSETDWQNHS
jgi:transposase